MDLEDKVSILEYEISELQYDIEGLRDNGNTGQHKLDCDDFYRWCLIELLKYAESPLL